MKIITTPEEHQLIIQAVGELMDHVEDYQYTQCQQYGDEWYEAQMEYTKLQNIMAKLKAPQ